MNRLVMIVVLLSLPAAMVSAQAELEPATSTPECDWNTWAGIPNAMTTMGGHQDIALTWDCPMSHGVIDYMWREMNFYKWDGINNGYDAPCNTATPIGRALNALLLMGYATTNNPSCDVNGDNMLDWALCWSASWVEQFNVSCVQEDPTLLGRTSYYLLGSDYTTIMPNGLYRQEIERTSSLIMHESRHWGCGHNADDDQCARRGSCDQSWDNGCDEEESQPGANRYDVTWLSWYANYSIRGSWLLQSDASVRANEILSSGFRRDPCFRLDENGIPHHISLPDSGC